jgi:integrase
LTPFLGTRLLQKFRADDVEVWHTHLLTKGRLDGTGGLSTRTVGHAHKLLKRVLRDAARSGLVLKNVAAEVRAPKIVAPEMRILSPRQVKDLPAMLAGRDIWAPAVVALFTGMRRGELLALRWPDVDLAGKTIRIHAALEQTVAHGTRFKDTKTKSGVRVIALPEIVVERCASITASSSKCVSRSGSARRRMTRSCSPRPAPNGSGTRMCSAGFGRTWRPSFASASRFTRCATRTPRN